MKLDVDKVKMKLFSKNLKSAVKCCRLPNAFSLHKNVIQARTSINWIHYWYIPTHLISFYRDQFPTTVLQRLIYRFAWHIRCLRALPNKDCSKCNVNRNVSTPPTHFYNVQNRKDRRMFVLSTEMFKWIVKILITFHNNGWYNFSLQMFSRHYLLLVFCFTYSSSTSC